MKNTLITIILVYLSLTCFAQSFDHEIADLKSAYKLEKNKIKQNTILNDIAYAYRRTSIDSLLFYANLAFDKASALNDRRNIGYALKNKGIASFKNGDDYVRSLDLYNDALTIAHEINDYHLQASSLNNIGLVYYTISQFESSIQFYFEGLKLYDEKINKQDLLKGLLICNIAASYKALNMFDKEYAFFKMGLEYAKKNKIDRIWTIYCDDYVLSMVNNNREFKALKLCKECIENAKKSGDIHSLIQSTALYAKLNFQNGNLKLAKTFADQTFDLSQKNNIQIEMAEVILLQAKCELALENIDKAESLGLEAFAKSDDSQKYWIKPHICHFLSELYTRKGDQENAKLFNQKGLKWENNEQDINIKYHNAESSLKYQNKYNTTQIELLKTEKRLTEKISNLYKGLTALLLAILVFGFRQYRQKQTSIQKVLKLNNDLSGFKSTLESKNNELQKYIESNIQLEQFAHIASHDLRSPLITINSFTKLVKKLTKDKISIQEFSYLNFIEKSGMQMVDLINDLLDYSKINSQKISPENCNSKEIVKAVIELLQNQNSEKSFNFTMQRNLPAIYADKIKIKRVFQNIVSNAIKFSKANETNEIEISAFETGTHWNFKISDTGIGMRMDVTDIFAPHVQLNKKSEYPGSGLGLSVCKKIIEQHGGEIKFESEVGLGTTFNFSISKNLDSQK